MAKLVIALGGNALGNNAKEQLELVKHTAKTIVELCEEGHEVIISHGNGPQVGMINLAMDFSSTHGGNTPAMPFPECGAMSQGYIGYHLQQAIQNELHSKGLKKDVVSLITQVVVDQNDEAFKNPTKPIGSFYTKEEAEKLQKENGFTYVEDAGRGYRRVVPSPIPQKIVELKSIENLSNSGTIVIAVGGGGIPVIEKDNNLFGVPAVIDKDRSSAKLAQDLKADMLIILTAVEKVAINFNTPDQKNLDKITISEAKEFIKQNQFAKGSMLPKIEACLEFLNHSDGKALITSLIKAKEAIKGKTGTLITKG